jgi:hypothetical protein
MAASDLGAVLDLATAAGVQQPRLDPTPVGWLGVVHGRIPQPVTTELRRSPTEQDHLSRSSRNVAGVP